MKRLFRIFLKEYSGMMTYEHITIGFNKWVSGSVHKEGRLKGLKRFNFKAHTTKPTVIKWLNKDGVRLAW